MSLQNILKQDTKNQEWASIWVNKLNGADVPTGGAVVDATTGAFDVSKFSVTVGSGQIATTSISNILYEIGDKKIIIGHVRYINVNAPDIAPNVGSLRVSLDISDYPHTAYPVLSEPLCGTINARCTEGSGGAFTAIPYTSSRVLIDNSNTLILEVNVGKNISAPLASRVLDIYFTLTYE